MKTLRPPLILVAFLSFSVFLFFLIRLTAAGDEMKLLKLKASHGEDTIRETGVSEIGQDQYKAMTSAKIIAQANLMSTIEGTFIERIVRTNGGKKIGEEIRTRVKGTLAGAKPCGAVYHADQGYAEVCLEIKLKGKGGLYEALSPYTFRKVEGDQQYELTGPASVLQQ